MPSGSKKRKASKKPKPGEPPSSQGEPPELETGLEESMAKDGEDMVEGSPSPKAMDEATEAMAEGGVEEGEDLIEKALQERDEVADLFTPPPGLEPVIPTISGAEAPDGGEVDGEAPVDLAQEDPTPQIMEEIDVPPRKTEPESDPPPAEIKPEVEADAAHTEMGDDTVDGGAPRNGVVSEADETESKKAAGSEPLEAHIGSEPRLEESLVEVKNVAHEDTEPENDTTPPHMAVVEVDEAPVEMNPAMDAAPVDAQPENDKATIVRELDLDAASPNIEPEGTDVAPVETAADTDEGPASAQSEMDEAVVERQLETDAVPKNMEMAPVIAPVDDQPEIYENPPADIEPAAADEAFFEATAKTDENVLSEMEETVIERQLETDAVPSRLEQETTAATAESELEKDTAQVEGDASTGENQQEVQPPGPSIDLQPDASECDMEASTDVVSAETEPETDITMRELEYETEPSPDEIKPKLDATLDDTDNDEVAQAETEPEVNASLVDTEQDEVAEPDIEPELEERASEEVEPEVESESAYAPLETEGDVLNEIEPDPEISREASEEVEAVTEPTTQEVEHVVHKAEPANEDLTEASEADGFKEDLNQGMETPSEVDTEPEKGTTQEFEQVVGKAEPAIEPLLETSEVKGSEEDLNQGVETPLEANSEPEEGNFFVIELEAKADFPELEPESNPDQKGHIAPESDQQDLVEAEQEQPIVNDYEAELGVEALELPASEADQVELSAVSVDSNQGAADGQLDEPTDYIVEQERAVIDDGGDEGKASKGEAIMTVVPSEQESGIELPLADTIEVPVGEEPHEGELVSEQSQPTLDRQDLTLDSRFVDLSSGESEKVEQGSNSTLPPEPQMAISANESKDGVVFGQELNSDSPSGDVERDIGEEEGALSTVAEAGSEGASSTVAEAGSVLTDFDGSASYQQLPTDFPISDQDADISESRVFYDTSAVEGLPEQIDGECGEHAQVEQERSVADQSGGGDAMGLIAAVEDTPKEEVEYSESTSEHEEVFPESARADEPATNLSSSLNKLPVYVGLAEEGNAKERDVNFVEARVGGDENGQEAAPLVFDAEDLMSKDSPSDTDGAYNMPSSEAPTGFDDNAAVNTDEAEICTVESEDLKAPSGDDLEKNFSGAPLQAASPGRDIEDVQTFHQQKIQEASLPVVVPAQDVKQRAMEQVNWKSNEPPSGGSTLKGRNKLLGCCGLFDVLLGKN